MSRFSAFKRVSRRHRLPMAYALLYEAFIRLYALPWARKCLKFFFKEERPSRSIFILGCYNSGTTILKDCVALHPDVTTPPVEGSRLTQSIPDFDGSDWPRGMFGNLYQIQSYRQLGGVSSAQYFSDIRPWVSANKVLLEKSISCSVLMPQIDKEFSNPKYLVVLRGVEGVMSGIQKKSRPRGVAKKILGGEIYPENFLVAQWDYLYSTILKDIADPSRVKLVVFEEFLIDPISELRDVFRFFDLPPADLSMNGNLLSVSGRDIEIHAPRADADSSGNSAAKVGVMRSLFQEGLGRK